RDNRLVDGAGRQDRQEARSLTRNIAAPLTAVPFRVVGELRASRRRVHPRGRLAGEAEPKGSARLPHKLASPRVPYRGEGGHVHASAAVELMTDAVGVYERRVGDGNGRRRADRELGRAHASDV